MRGIAPHRLSNVSFRNLLRFSAKPTKFVIARRACAPNAAIFNDAICHSETKYGCAERNRTLESRERKRNEATNPMFFVIGLPSCFPLPCFVPGCRLVPFKIAASGAKLRPPRNDKIGRFCRKTKQSNDKIGRFCGKTKQFSERKDSNPSRRGAAKILPDYRWDTAKTPPDHRQSERKKAKEKSQCERIHTGFWCARRDLNPHVRSGH